MSILLIALSIISYNYIFNKNNQLLFFNILYYL